MSADFDKALDMRGIHSTKWEFMKKIDSRARATTIPFWLADMDFPCAGAITDAIKTRAARQVLGYASIPSDSYMDAITAWYMERFGWRIAPESVCYCPGVVAALSLLVNILSDKGDGVIIQRPVYPPFSRVIEMNGRIVVNNRLRNEDGFYSLDFDDLEAKCRDNKLLIFCSPHNPVGRVWSGEELTRLLEICDENDVTIVSDEIHCDLTRAGVRHHSLARLAREGSFKNTTVITCTAPSKTFNIAGLSHSHIIIDRPDIRARWNEYGMYSPNPVSIVAMEAAYSQGAQWLSSVLEYLDGNFSFMESFISSEIPDVGFQKPEGTYLAWLDFSRHGTSSEIFELLLERADIMVQKGTDFGIGEGEGFVRFNAACPRNLINEGLTRIAKALGGC